MPTIRFLDLPRELRDDIYIRVLPSRILAPKHPSQWSAGMNPQNLNFSTLKSLLLVCRQMKKEVHETLEFLCMKSQLYELDVMLVDEYLLYPTWVAVPCLRTRIDTLSVSLRVFGVWSSFCGYSFEQGNLPRICCRFCILLEQILCEGPATKLFITRDRRISIKNLNINILSPEVPDGFLSPELFPKNTNEVLGGTRQFFDKLLGLRRTSGKSLLMNPMDLAAFFSFMFEMLLRMDSWFSKYELDGNYLYERIGIISLSVDGKLYKEFDLTKQLGHLSWKNFKGQPLPKEECKASLKERKAKVYKERIRYGYEKLGSLPVV